MNDVDKGLEPSLGEAVGRASVFVAAVIVRRVAFRAACLSLASAGTAAAMYTGIRGWSEHYDEFVQSFRDSAKSYGPQGRKAIETTATLFDCAHVLGLRVRMHEVRVDGPEAEQTATEVVDQVRELFRRERQRARRDGDSTGTSRGRGRRR